jgi:hypothetical protein
MRDRCSNRATLREPYHSRTSKDAKRGYDKAFIDVQKIQDRHGSCSFWAWKRARVSSKSGLMVYRCSLCLVSNRDTCLSESPRCAVNWFASLSPAIQELHSVSPSASQFRPELYLADVVVLGSLADCPVI